MKMQRPCVRRLANLCTQKEHLDCKSETKGTMHTGQSQTKAQEAYISCTHLEGALALGLANLGCHCGCKVLCVVEDARQ